MTTATLVLAAFVAFEHAFFLVLEMFLWTTPFGRKVFRNSPEKAESSKVLAQNQGLYNGFLAAGLVWAIVMGGDEGRHAAVFFFGCVVVAGAFGAVTTKSGRLFVIQGVPAIAGLAAALM